MTKRLEIALVNAVKFINQTAPRQHDQWNWCGGAARSLAASTHGAASHLTKTLVVIEDDVKTKSR